MTVHVLCPFYPQRWIKKASSFERAHARVQRLSLSSADISLTPRTALRQFRRSSRSRRRTWPLPSAKRHPPQTSEGRANPLESSPLLCLPWSFSWSPWVIWSWWFYTSKKSWFVCFVNKRLDLASWRTNGRQMEKIKYRCHGSIRGIQWWGRGMEGEGNKRE